MSDEEHRLKRLFRRLSAEQRASLLDYAQFLASRSPPPAPLEVVDIPRPTQESVVAAMKRLTATYPMVKTEQLLNDSAGLMAQHLMHGRAAAEVIDELENLFRSAYQRMNQA